MEQRYELELINIRKIVLEKLHHTELYIPLHGKHTTNPEEESFDLAEKINSFCVFNDASAHDPKVMLLMGDTGSGKSVFSQQLYQQLWKDYQQGGAIPLWISLPELENPFEGAVEEVLTKYEFSETQVSEMKAEERFIFVVDGYDELHQFQNCYVTNKWHKWKAKILITCRSQALYYQNDPDKYFMPFNGEKRLPMLLRRLYVAPFSTEQISAYVKKYQELNPDNKIMQEDFTKVPGLTELLTTPFLLHMAIEALPDILANQVDDQKITQAKLYDVFIERWFTRQVKKLNAARLLTDTEQTTKQQFWDYCKNLAIKMHENNVSVIPYRGQKVGGRLFGKQEQTISWAIFFSEEMELIRSACPLRRYGEHHYGFVHASMVEYFATRSMYEEIQDEQSEKKEQANESNRKENVNEVEDSQLEINYQLQGGIHQRVFALERNSIQFLADRIVQNSKFKQKMLTILKASKTKEIYSIAAANAITALVRAGVVFNGEDLSGINISGADLSGGYFSATNFQGANFFGVRFFQAWLQRANLRESNLLNADFGEHPHFPHEESVNDIDYRPDLNRLVTAAGKKVLIWDITSGQCIHSLEGHEDTVSSVSMSEDGNIVASGSWDKTLRVWNIVGDHCTILRGHQAKIKSVHISADGHIVASGGNDSTVRVWNLKQGKNVVLRGHEHWIESVCLSLDGRTVVSGSGDNTVRLWDVNEAFETMLLLHDQHVMCVHLSEDGKKLVTGSKDNSVRAWDLISLNAKVLQGHHELVTGVQLSEDGLTVVSGSWDNTVRLWDLNTRKSVILRGHASRVTSIHLSKDGRTLATGSEDNTVRVWNAVGWQDSMIHIEKQPEYIHVSEDGCTVVSSSANTTRKKTPRAEGYQWVSHSSIRVRNVLTEKSIVLIEEEHIMNSKKESHSLGIVHISADGRFVVTGEGNGYIQVWDVASGKKSTLLTAKDAYYPSYCIYLSKDNRTIASGSFSYVYVWDIATEKVITLEHFNLRSKCIHLSTDGSTVASGGINEDVCVWDLPSKKKTLLKGHKGIVSAVCLNADGSSVASGSYDNTVRVWDVASGNAIILTGHRKPVIALHYCAEGRIVLSGSLDNTVRVWDLQKHSELCVIQIHVPVDSFSMNDNSGVLTIVSKSGVSQHWQRLDNTGANWQLQWSSEASSSFLMLENCDVTGSRGVSSKNSRLLSQRRALGVSDLEKVNEYSKVSLGHLSTTVGKRSGSPLHQGLDHDEHTSTKTSNEHGY